MEKQTFKEMLDQLRYELRSDLLRERRGLGTSDRLKRGRALCSTL